MSQNINRIKTIITTALVLMLALNMNALSARFNPYITKLSNGLKLVVLENHKSPIVKVQIWYKAGSREDPEGKSGIAHFMEHLMFRCSTDELEPKQYEEEIKTMGGSHNAFTSYDMTSYFATVPSKYCERVIEMEASRMAKFELDDKTVDQERGVILSEREMMIDKRPGVSFGEDVRALTTMHDRSKLPVIGWRHEMEGLTKQDAIDFHRKWYKPNNAILIISGDITKERAKELAKKYFGPIEPGKLRERIVLSEPDKKGLHIRIEKEDPEVATPYIDYIFNVKSLYGKVSLGIKDHYALKILTSILNRVDGKLYQDFVKNKKIAEGISVGYYGYGMGMGNFYLSATLAKDKKLDDLENEMNEFLQYLKSKPITNEQLEKEKEEIIRSMRFEKDHIFAGSGIIGRTLSVDFPIDYVEDVETIINNVTIDDINRNIDNLFKDNNKKVAILKPRKKAQNK